MLGLTGKYASRLTHKSVARSRLLASVMASVYLMLLTIQPSENFFLAVSNVRDITHHVNVAILISRLLRRNPTLHVDCVVHAKKKKAFRGNRIMSTPRNHAGEG